MYITVHITVTCDLLFFVCYMIIYKLYNLIESTFKFITMSTNQSSRPDSV